MNIHLKNRHRFVSNTICSSLQNSRSAGGKQKTPSTELYPLSRTNNIRLSAVPPWFTFWKHPKCALIRIQTYPRQITYAKTSQNTGRMYLFWLRPPRSICQAVSNPTLILSGSLCSLTWRYLRFNGLCCNYITQIAICQYFFFLIFDSSKNIFTQHNPK